MFTHTCLQYLSESNLKHLQTFNFSQQLEEFDMDRQTFFRNIIFLQLKVYSEILGQLEKFLAKVLLASSVNILLPSLSLQILKLALGSRSMDI